MHINPHIIELAHTWIIYPIPTMWQWFHFHPPIPRRIYLLWYKLYELWIYLSQCISFSQRMAPTPHIIYERKLCIYPNHWILWIKNDIRTVLKKNPLPSESQNNIHEINIAFLTMILSFKLSISLAFPCQMWTLQN